MKIISSLPVFGARIPDNIDELEYLFRAGYPTLWVHGGSVQIHFGEGEYLHMAMVANSQYGIWLSVRGMNSLGESSCYLSLGDRSKIHNYVESDDFAYTLEGLYISPELAWCALRDFIVYEGERSKEVEWIDALDLPEGKSWLIAKDLI